MIENMKESQKTDVTASEFSAEAEIQKVYEEAELKYGPGFAQYCVDALVRAQEPPKTKVSKNQRVITLIRLTNQLHTLSKMCSADCFHAWGIKDKLSYMTLLTAVSDDLSQALQGSLNEIKASNDQETSAIHANALQNNRQGH